MTRCAPLIGPGHAPQELRGVGAGPPGHPAAGGLQRPAHPRPQPGHRHSVPALQPDHRQDQHHVQSR